MGHVEKIEYVFAALMKVSIMSGVIGSIIKYIQSYQYISSGVEVYVSYNLFVFIPLLYGLIAAIYIFYPVKVKLHMYGINTNQNHIQ